MTAIGPSCGESGTLASVTARVGLVPFPTALVATTMILKIFPGGESPVIEACLNSGRLLRPGTSVVI